MSNPQADYNNPFFTRGCRHEPTTDTSKAQHYCHGCSKLADLNYMDSIPIPPGYVLFDCCEVRFKNSKKGFFKIPPELDIELGDIVALIVKELRAAGKNMFRVNHRTWWKEEMPSTTEYMEGIVNLAKANNKVDFMFTHCAPSSVLSYPSDEETAYFNDIMQQTSYKWWGCGHYHYERFFSPEKVEILYNSIRQIA